MEWLSSVIMFVRNHKLKDHQDDNEKLIEEIHSYIFKLSHNNNNNE